RNGGDPRGGGRRGRSRRRRVSRRALTGLDAAGHGLPPPPLWRRGMSDSTWKRTLGTLVRPTLRVRRDRRYRVETPRPAGEKPEDEHRLPLDPRSLVRQRDRRAGALGAARDPDSTVHWARSGKRKSRYSSGTGAAAAG